ncbi:unnamed protein product [Mucor fragilis]
MSKAAVLPKEVLSKIFGYSDYAAELGGFRAVCKSRDAPAAKVMFGRKISISSETEALKLYRHLFKDASKIPLIRHMDFKLDGTKLTFIFEELLRLALTPTVEKVTGDVKDAGFFKTIFDIADKSSIKYDKIKSLPVYSGDRIDVSIGKLLMIRNHQQVLQLPLSYDDRILDFAKQLDQFPKLSHLYLSGTVNELKEIEEVFKGCPHLTFIRIKGLEFNASTNIMPKSEINAWLAVNVQKYQLATTLEVDSSCRPELLEYLTYRYPNTKKNSNQRPFVVPK